MEQIEIRAKCSQCGTPNLVIISQTQGSKSSCSQCKSVLLEYEPVRGYLYVLSNEQMAGVVKIGFSTRPVEERVAELNSGTAVPAPFVIEGIFPSIAPERHERGVHDLLATTRLPGREFFRVALPDALQAASQVCGGPPKYLRNPPLLINLLHPPIHWYSCSFTCKGCGSYKAFGVEPFATKVKCPSCQYENNVNIDWSEVSRA
jgi:hypothetical protein